MRERNTLQEIVCHPFVIRLMTDKPWTTSSHSLCLFGQKAASDKMQAMHTTRL